MSSNYFNNYDNFAEQELHSDLIEEAIKIYGVESPYCPRTLNRRDQIYGTDDISSYNTFYMLDMYVKNAFGFTGDGRFFSKFNLEIRDEITFCVSRRTFENSITQGNQTGVIDTQLIRPREGDLVFWPLNQKIYIIKYVQHESLFYPFGQFPIYELVCEQFEYSSEQLNTGVPQIDILQAQFTTNMSDFALLTEGGLIIDTEDGFDLILELYSLIKQTGISTSDNKDLNTEVTNNILDFSEVNPFGETSFLGTDNEDN